VTFLHCESLKKIMRICWEKFEKYLGGQQKILGAEIMFGKILGITCSNFSKFRFIATYHLRQGNNQLFSHQRTRILRYYKLKSCPWANTLPTGNVNPKFNSIFVLCSLFSDPPIKVPNAYTTAARTYSISNISE
jgi:hypothetical protein